MAARSSPVGPCTTDRKVTTTTAPGSCNWQLIRVASIDQGCFSLSQPHDGNTHLPPGGGALVHRLISSLKIAPALTGLALLAGVAVASPTTAAAATPCQDLAWAFYYHYNQGNTDYAGQ